MPISYSVFLQYVPLCSVFDILNSPADVILKMKYFPFQFIRLKQSLFCFGLRLLLPSTISDSSYTDCSGKIVSSSWGGQILSDVVYKFQGSFQIYFLSCFLTDIPLIHRVDLDIRYTISMWDNFSTNWPHSQSWLVCWISRDQNEIYPKSALFFYAPACNSKVVLEPNFLKVDRTQIWVIWAPDWIQLQ